MCLFSCCFVLLSFGKAAVSIVLCLGNGYMNCLSVLKAKYKTLPASLFACCFSERVVLVGSRSKEQRQKASVYFVQWSLIEDVSNTE